MNRHIVKSRYSVFSWISFVLAVALGFALLPAYANTSVLVIDNQSSCPLELTYDTQRHLKTWDIAPHVAPHSSWRMRITFEEDMFANSSFATATYETRCHLPSGHKDEFTIEAKGIGGLEPEIKISSFSFNGVVNLSPPGGSMIPWQENKKMLLTVSDGPEVLANRVEDK